MQKARRTVPYVVKNQWQLALPPTYAELKSRANVPKNWRLIKSLDPWKRQMFALKEKFPEGWNPNRKLSRDKMDELRERRKLDPSLDNTQLGSIYRISPEAVRRILKSKWDPKGK